MNNTTIGYIRVSTAKQADQGVSLEAQEEALRSYCKTYGLNMVEVIADRGVSAKTLRREGMLRLLRLVEAGEVAAVVIYKLDRAFRSIRDALGVIWDFERRGVELHSVMEKLDTTTPVGRFARTILVALGELEREQISERTREALRATKGSNGGNALLDHRMKRGLLVVGQAPYGYQWVQPPLGKKKALVQDVGEMELVKTVQELRGEGLSARGIAKELNRREIHPRRGKFWHATQIQRILAAEFYG